MDPQPGGLSPATTRAAVWHGGDRVEVEDVRVPVPGDGELVVRVSLATVCGSDRHTVAGHRPGPAPSILGHEAVGVVVGTGAGAAAALGDRVVWGVTASCGACDRCLAGRTAKCRDVRKTGHEPFDSDWALSGGYAEHVLLPAGLPVVGVPDDLPDAVVAPAACATATVMAVLDRAGPLKGERVLVSGAGMLGITATAAVVAAGAGRVVVSDVDEGRLATATAFGATDVVGPDRPVPEVDVVLELSGAVAAVERGLSALDVGGRIVLAGSVSPGPTVPLDPERLVRGWMSVLGVHNYEPRHLRQAVDFLHETRGLPWDGLVAPPRPLEEVGRLLTSPSRAPRASVSPSPGPRARRPPGSSVG